MTILRVNYQGVDEGAGYAALQDYDYAHKELQYWKKQLATHGKKSETNRGYYQAMIDQWREQKAANLARVKTLIPSWQARITEVEES